MSVHTLSCFGVAWAGLHMSTGHRLIDETSRNDLHGVSLSQIYTTEDAPIYPHLTSNAIVSRPWFTQSVSVKKSARDVPAHVNYLNLLPPIRGVWLKSKACCIPDIFPQWQHPLFPKVHCTFGWAEQTCYVTINSDLTTQFMPHTVLSLVSGRECAPWYM